MYTDWEWNWEDLSKMGIINVSILVRVLYSGFIRCYYGSGENRADGYGGKKASH